MEQSSYPTDRRYHHAHLSARTLHDALAALGVPETELTTLTSRPDAAGHPRVHIPSLSPESVVKVLRALGPSLGPEWVPALTRLGVPDAVREAS